MTDTSANQNPDRRELRNFGLIMGAMLALIFGLLLPWIWSGRYPTWPWIAAGVFVLWGLALPGSLGPVYRVWMKIGGVLGWINNRIILGLVFYVVIFPVGLARRVFGRDPMARRFDQNASSYRIDRSVQPTRDKMERPF